MKKISVKKKNSNMNIYLKSALICIMVLKVSSTFAQFDPMFTHYMFNESFINPAYTGSREQLSLTGVWREQWVGINGAPSTQSFSIHSPMKNSVHGLGLNFLNDKIGVTRRTMFSPTYAFRIPMKKGKLALGVSAGMQLYQERLSEVETNTLNDINFLSNTPNLFLPNFGFGTMYYTDKFYIGLSIPRLLKNEIYFDNKRVVNSRLTPSTFHYYLAAGYLQKLNPQLTLKPSVLIKATSGAPVQADISLNVMFREFLWIGATYRTGDAICGLLGIQLSKNLRVGYSYDYTLTDLQQFTSGSHELVIGYDFSINKKSVVTPRFF
jgi:type IX secretion system PorP/SprF family membrane protein